MVHTGSFLLAEWRKPSGVLLTARNCRHACGRHINGEIDVRNGRNGRKPIVFSRFFKFERCKTSGFAAKILNWLIAKAISWYNAGVEYAELFHISPNFELAAELVSKVDLRW